MDFIDQLKSHRSIRKFSGDKIKDAELHDWVQAAQSASTSHHVQAYHIIEVTQDDMRDQIGELAGGQRYVSSAARFLVFCADLRKIQLAAASQNRSADFNLESTLTAIIDVSLLAQNLMLCAESQGYGGVFIGGIRNDLTQIVKLLKVPPLVIPLFGMCLGKPDQNPDFKPRFPLNAVLSKDGYPDDNELKSALEQYDQTMTDYYASRKYSTREDNWSQMIANFVGKPHREYLRGLVDSQKFSLD